MNVQVIGIVAVVILVINFGGIKLGKRYCLRDNLPLVMPGCIFALDSDAHTTSQLAYAETAVAHARLAGIPAARILNTWSLDRLLEWLSKPASERLQ